MHECVTIDCLAQHREAPSFSFRLCKLRIQLSEALQLEQNLFLPLSDSPFSLPLCYEQNYLFFLLFYSRLNQQYFITADFFRFPRALLKDFHTVFPSAHFTQIIHFMCKILDFQSIKEHFIMVKMVLGKFSLKKYKKIDYMQLHYFSKVIFLIF